MRYVSTGFNNYESRSTSAHCVESGVSLTKRHLITAITQDIYAVCYIDPVTLQKVRYFTGQSNVVEGMILFFFSRTLLGIGDVTTQLILSILRMVKQGRENAGENND